MAPSAWEMERIILPDGGSAEAICPVIVSASRATDISAFFAEWFMNRLRAGYLRRANPFNPRQVQCVSFSRTRAIVFWSKNPRPLIRHLPELDARGLHYCLQFTLNDYEREGLEPNVPPLAERIETFRELSERLGRKRVIWRYDPLLLTDTLWVDTLMERLAGVASQLRGHTEKLVISFADIGIYRKVRGNLSRAGVNYLEFTPALMEAVAERIQRLNREWGLKVATCAEGIDLSRYGIEHNRCIDDNLMIELFGDDPALMRFLGHPGDHGHGPDLFGEPPRPDLKDRGQRKECGCIVSKDIGMYDTCRHLCVYCYANASCGAVESRWKQHDPKGESLVP